MKEKNKKAISWNLKELLQALIVPLAALLVQPVIYSVLKCISWRGVRRSEKRYMDESFHFRSIL